MATAPRRRIQLTGTVQIVLPPEEAFTLFTPSGERTWAHGWDPKFPSPGADETEPGTVFQTDHGDRESIWTVVRCTPGELIQYAMVTPGDRCGLVAVSCQASPGGTEATVSYDLTSLSEEADGRLEQFARDYLSFLRNWEQSIARVAKANLHAAGQHSGPRP